MRAKSRLWLAVFLVLAFPLVAAADCNSYNGSGMDYQEGYGHYCGGTGPSCTECVNFHPGGVQVCIYVTFWDIYCTDYGQEFQWI
jgi:predicted small secreted protein